MMKKWLLFFLCWFNSGIVQCQNIVVPVGEIASLESIYGIETESEELQTFEEVGVEFGYVLYKTDFEVEVEKEYLLEVENVRDYVAVYVDDLYVGSLTFSENSVRIHVSPGRHVLKMYVENIGRITYGPEILDNSKGIFGIVTFDKRELKGWRITPLQVSEVDHKFIQYRSLGGNDPVPAFYRGMFDTDRTEALHLDMSGWGMGEVWINGQYAGSYWEKNSQRSLPIPESFLRKGKNEVIIFELTKRSHQVYLSDRPVFVQ